MRERIWYEDPAGFFHTTRLFDVIPSPDVGYESRLNRVVRLVMYVSIVCFFVTASMRCTYPLVLVAIGSYALLSAHRSSSGEDYHESSHPSEEEPSECTRPTRDNPFMNVTMDEYIGNPKRAKACAVARIHPEMDARYRENKPVDVARNESLYQGVPDVLSRDASLRQYYTMPSTTIPNAQGEFANWLYGIEGKTCKEGEGIRCPFTPRNS